MERSPQWRRGRFENPQPLRNDPLLALRDVFARSAHATPAAPVPTAPVDPAQLATPAPGGLRVTWLGHSTLLLEVDGVRVLVDPVWGQRASPFTVLGPRRFYPPLVGLADLPPLDAVLVSHDHYDHLDLPTVRGLLAVPGLTAPFIVPLGVGAHLEAWGVPPERVVELDWWERRWIRGVVVVATPARHASGRGLRRNQTLWCGFALLGPRRRAWYSGDTGLFPGLADLGARLGPFDLAMVEAGAYGRAWPDWHIGPEQAVIASRLVRAALLVPVHWGLFNLAFHGWTEPPERVLAAAREHGQAVALPRPGEPVEPGALVPAEPWWPRLPWRSAKEDPIVSTFAMPAAQGSP
jgi:L-ascorbate metabolism protein UlaG (beta-lactamase superfamily)